MYSPTLTKALIITTVLSLASTVASVKEDGPSVSTRKAIVPASPKLPLEIPFPMTVRISIHP
jgi:hypothetical protein